MRKEDRRKICSRISSFVNEGDLFYSYFENQLFVIQLVKKLSRAYEGCCEFREIDSHLFMIQLKNYFLEHKEEELKQLVGKDSSS